MMPTREGKLGLGLLLLLASLLAPGRASGFCRTTTVRPSGDLPTGTCIVEGLPLFLPSQCLPYRLRSVESSVIPNAVLSEKLARAFAAWTAPNATCVPRVSGIELAPVGDVPIRGFERGGGQNMVGVVADWDARAEGSTLELVTFSSETGEILDVDVEINPNVVWSFGDIPSADAVDLQTAMTHTVGHMLGFAHSPDPTSVMFASILPGEVRRVPNADDLAGICSVYASPRAPCVLTAGSPDARCDDKRIMNGCTASDASGSTGVSVFFGVIFLMALRWLRKRQQPI